MRLSLKEKEVLSEAVKVFIMEIYMSLMFFAFGLALGLLIMASMVLEAVR